MKISLIGNSCAGKSTLVSKLKETTNIPCHILDMYLLEKDESFKPVSEERFLEIQRHLLKDDSWILEGVAYMSSIEERFVHSDLIVFLDISSEICKERGIKRRVEQETAKNGHVPASCNYKDVAQYQDQAIDYFENTMKPEILKLIGKHNKRHIFLRNDEDIESFIINFSSQE